MNQVTIVNMALGLVGDLGKVKRMTAFTRTGCGSSTILNVLFDFYEAAKKRMIAARKWQGSRKFKALTASDDDPLMDGKWGYKYARPADCWILEKVCDDSENEYEYEVVVEENASGQNVRWIYANEADLYAKYAIDMAEEDYLPGMGMLHALYLAEAGVSAAISDPAKAAAIRADLVKREPAMMAAALKENYVANETGANELTDLY